MSSHSTIFFRSRPSGGAQLPLRIIQAMPPRPRGVVHIVVGEVGDDIRRVGVQRFRQVAGIIVGQEHFDRSLASDLVLPMSPTGPRLIHPVTYTPGTISRPGPQHARHRWE